MLQDLLAELILVDEGLQKVAFWRFRILALGFRVEGFGFQGLGFRVRV